MRLEVGDAVRRRGMPFSSMLVADRVGRPIIPVRRVDGEAILVTRSDLLDALVNALPADTLVLGRQVEQVDEHPAMTRSPRERRGFRPRLFAQSVRRRPSD